MTAEAAILFIHAQTSLHPGTGTALGTVDLPIQRERHTQWPTIAGSSLKGVLRDACREKIASRSDLDDLERYDDRPDKKADRKKGSRRERADATMMLNRVFGPPTSGAGEFAGAVSVTDARILAFPVRSLKGVFAWVTCRSVLERLHRDLSLGTGLNGLHIPPVTAPGQAHCPDNSPLFADGQNGKKLVFEEFEFDRSQTNSSDVANWIASYAVQDQFTKDRLKTNLVVIGDDEFGHFVQHACEVVARVALDYDHKTVKSGALFYEEFLPAETLLYSVVLANPSRQENDNCDAPRMINYLETALRADGDGPALLQIGGDETIGKGLCAVRLCRERKVRNDN